MSTYTKAVETWRAGGLVAFPTETVYGIGADADNPDAVRRLFAVKRRPADQPITIHLGPAADPDEWGVLSAGARRLAEAFWPGPLTLIVPSRTRVPSAVTGGQSSVGIRVPDHAIAIALLDAFGGGVAASSANRRGEPPPVTAKQASIALAGDYDVLVDSDLPPSGIASTVLDLSGSPRILRQGALTKEQLEQLLGTSIL